MLLDSELGFESIRRLEFCRGLESRIGNDLEIEGELLLANIIEGAHFHGLDHRLGGAEGAHENDESVWRVLADSYQKLESGEWVEIRLGHDEFRLLHAKGLVGGIGGVLHEHANFRTLQLVFCPIQKITITIDHKNCLLLRHIPFFFRVGI